MERRYEHAACGLLTTGADGTILSVNQTLLAWIGAQRDELVGRRTFSDLLTGGGRIYHETHYAPLLAMQGSAREIAFDLLGSGGRRLSVLVNARAEVVDGDRVIHVAVFDATERRMYERELLAAKERAERSEAQSQVLARTLQETLLPHRLPTIPGLDVAGVYLAAGAGHEIGGDFYDVFQVRPDDWIIALGDVEGKGVDAAVVTALVRYSIRAAAVEHEPSGVLRIVNEILLRDDTPRFCTAVVLRCRRNRGNWRITISCRGHRRRERSAPQSRTVRRRTNPRARGPLQRSSRRRRPQTSGRRCARVRWSTELRRHRSHRHSPGVQGGPTCQRLMATVTVGVVGWSSRRCRPVSQCDGGQDPDPSDRRGRARVPRLGARSASPRGRARVAIAVRTRHWCAGGDVGSVDGGF